MNEDAAYRHGEYDQAAVSGDNSGAALFPQLTIIAELDSEYDTNQGNIFIPRTPQVFSYDADGNLTNDGRWTFTWDAENRLTSLVSLDGIPSAASNAAYYAYDDWGRRISKVVSNWTGSAWALAEDLRFLYDRWNLLAELDANGSPVRSYTWGQDLSSTLHGAGGVGGLLAMTVHSGENARTYFYSYDGNGNVIVLVDASNGVVVAQYEYDPFGGLIRATGELAEENKFRFSTKYYDDESDFVYYGHRYYSPSLGRWSNKDPIGERDTLNLYTFVKNAPNGRVDYLGLGTIMVDSSCKGQGDLLKGMTYYAESEPPDDGPKVHRSLPIPEGVADRSVDADAIYWGDGTATKIPNLRWVMIRCVCKNGKWSTKIERGGLPIRPFVDWKQGDPEPPNWPGHDQPENPPHRGTPPRRPLPPLNPGHGTIDGPVFK